MHASNIISIPGHLARLRQLGSEYFGRIKSDGVKDAAQIIVHRHPGTGEDAGLMKEVFGVSSNPLAGNSKYDLRFVQATMAELSKDEKGIEGTFRAIYDRCKELFVSFEDNKLLPSLLDNLVDDNGKDRKLLDQIMRYQVFTRIKEWIINTEKTGKVDEQIAEEIDKMAYLIKDIPEQDKAMDYFFRFGLQADEHIKDIPRVVQGLEEIVLIPLRGEVFKNLSENQ